MRARHFTLTLSISLVAAMCAWAQPPAPTRPLGPPPEGWSYLPELGEKDIFQLVARPAEGPAPQIRAHTVKDVGILTTPAGAPLTAATTLRWQWKMTQLPSAIAEDVTPGHDYFSIAVKFDNGQDLTYMWSSALPLEKGFRCPLRNWKDRETHVVVRTGAADFNRWVSEERNVLADYVKHVGGPPPARITHVWLIANSTIQKGEGDVSFARISLGDAPATRGRVPVL